MTGISEGSTNWRDRRIHGQESHEFQQGQRPVLWPEKSVAPDWRTTSRTACTSTEVESKQNMDEQRTPAAMNPNRKLHWINKNPASGLRKGNNCWTTPETLRRSGAQQYMKNDELQGAQQRSTKAHEKGWSTCEDRLRICLE